MRIYGNATPAGPTNTHTPPALRGAHLGPVTIDTSPLPTTAMGGNKQPKRQWDTQQIAAVREIWLQTGSYLAIHEQLGWITPKQAESLRRWHFPMLEPVHKSRTAPRRRLAADQTGEHAAPAGQACSESVSASGVSCG